MNMYLFWVIAIIAFGILEGVTAQLVSIWFVIGSVGALIATACGAPIWLQVVIFFVLSLAVLFAVRPVIRRQMKERIEKTNADRCIGQDGIVLEEIDNLLPKGQVKADGKVWTARSSDGSNIPEGAIVTVDRIDGVKLMVSRKTNA